MRGRFGVVVIEPSRRGAMAVEDFVALGWRWQLMVKAVGQIIQVLTVIAVTSALWPDLSYEDITHAHQVS